MLNKEDQVIDGMTYSVVQFPAMYGFALLARLAKCIGPALGALSSMGPGTNSDISQMGPVLCEALSTLDPDEAQRLALEILKSTSVIIPDATGGRRVEFTGREKIDEVFSGRLMTMFKVLGFAVKVNFSDFARGIGSQAKADPTKVGAQTSV